MRELAAEVLRRVGLLPPEDAPYERQDPLRSLTEREQKGAARLGAYFERFAAMKKAEAETCPPKPWMVEWARDLEEKLAKGAASLDQVGHRNEPSTDGALQVLHYWPFQSFINKSIGRSRLAIVNPQAQIEQASRNWRIPGKSDAAVVIHHSDRTGWAIQGL